MYKHVCTLKSANTGTCKYAYTHSHIQEERKEKKEGTKEGREGGGRKEGRKEVKCSKTEIGNNIQEVEAGSQELFTEVSLTEVAQQTSRDFFFLCAQDWGEQMELRTRGLSCALRGRCCTI